MLLEGKIALVTGASRGIGKAIAVKLAEAGAFVLGTATSETGVQKITTFFEEASLSGAGYVLDVGDPGAIAHFFSVITERHGDPHILVNNAAITRDNLLLRMDEDEWGRVIETNLSSVYRLSKFCLKAMIRARWGRIINVSSVIAVSGNAGQCNYAAAKAGIIGFSKSLAQEIASRNVTVNVVAPGFIDTDMTKDLPQMIRDELLKRIPMKRLGEPEDIANAVLFLSGEGARYITGTTLHINGGMYMV